MDANLTRRRVLAGGLLTFGALGAALTLHAPAAAQVTPILAWTPRALTSDEARVLDAVAERIIPTTDTPGGRTAGVPQFVDRTVADWCEPAEAARIREGLGRIDREARAAHGRPFASLDEARQTALLARYDQESATAPEHFFNSLRILATVGYFTSEIGATKALRYDPVPGDYRGCVPYSEIGRAWATS